MKLMIGWTTLATMAEAERLAHGMVEAKLAVCVQIDTGTKSLYRWEGKVEKTPEVRIWVKFTKDKASEIEAWLAAHHPYDTPQWVAVSAEIVAEKYLSWATTNPNS
jgi:periplasmic divalent cation tolerance protein